jgi:RNA polymerase sigma-B factor
VHATSPNDERALFARLREDPNTADREAAVRRYLPLARRLAGHYRHTGEPVDDLEQVAAIGLLKAVDRFDPERGATFTSFAIPTILGELRRYFRDRTWALRVPRGLQELTLQIERARDELTGSLGRQPTLTELSRRLGTSEELTLQALELSLARHSFPVDEGYARVEDRATLATLLATLSVRDARIVFLRFHEDLTQEAIARIVGVSQMHVSRVLYRSLAKLREAAGD